MKKRAVAALALILIVSLVSLASTGEPDSPRKIKLHVGQHARVGNLTFEFVAVVQDSRCPVNVQCITAGNAQIQVKIKDEKDSWTTVELSTADQASSVVRAGKELRFLDLLPHPKEGVPPVQSAYVAIFSVAESSSRPSPNQVGPPEQS